MPLVREILKGLVAKLGLNIEGHLVNYEPKTEVRKDGGLHIHQGKKSVTNIFILDSEGTREALKTGDLREAVQMSESGLGGMTREDLAPYDVLALTAQEDNKILMRRLKDVVSHDDLVALSIAMTIRKFEIHSQGARAQEYRNRLRKRYGERGNRIYVFYVSGMLEELMDPVLAWIEYAGTWSDKLEAKELWNACLEHMDYAIYVNKSMTEDDIVQGLRQRFRVDGVPVVLVFGRTDPLIEKIDRSVKKFGEVEGEYQIAKFAYRVTRKEYKIGDHRSLTCIVERIEAEAAAQRMTFASPPTAESADEE